MKRSKEIYKNAPLVETVFEIRFNINLAIGCQIDKFYEKIKKVYSEILIPKLINRKPSTL